MWQNVFYNVPRIISASKESWWWPKQALPQFCWPSEFPNFNFFWTQYSIDPQLSKKTGQIAHSHTQLLYKRRCILLTPSNSFCDLINSTSLRLRSQFKVLRLIWSTYHLDLGFTLCLGYVYVVFSLFSLKFSLTLISYILFLLLFI